MRLDARFPELDAFLQTWRARLNRRYLAGEALTAWAVAAPVAGLLTALLPPPLRGLGWLGTAVASAVFALVKARSRLSRHQTASWLDQHGPTEGVFRAASECLDATEPGAVAQRVLERAERVRRELPPPRVPQRWLARLGLATLASVAVIASTSVPWGLPRSHSEVAAKPSPASPAPGLVPNENGPVSPHDTAQRLFPEDPRMAALAEQALASGDPSALKSLIEQNGESKAAAAAGDGASGSQGGNGGDSRGGQGAAGGEPQAGGTQPSAPSSSQPSPRSRDQPSTGGGQQRQGRDTPGGGAGSGSGAQGQGQPSPRSPGNPGSGSGDTSVGSGGAPGQGHSDLSLGPIRKGNSEKTLTLNEPRAQGLYEYVLPGAGAKLPTAEVLADSRRAAEAVISRTTPPLEYESTIRDYFLSLSQEVSP